MALQKVKIQDFKILHNVEKDVQGNHILLLGDNGVGKSSFIQFIKIALGDQSCIPPDIKGGGEVVCDFNGKDYTFTLEFKNGKPVVTVKTPDGLQDSRKGTIAGIVGAISFDIDHFIELSKTDKGRKEQVEIFKSFLPEEVRAEIARFEANVKFNFDQRTENNRMVKEKEGAIKQHALYNCIDVEEFKPVNVDDAVLKLKEGNEKNQKIATSKAELENIKTKIAEENKTLSALKEDLKKLNEKITVSETVISDNEKRKTVGEKWLLENTVVNVAELEAKIKEAAPANETYNSAVALKKDKELVEKLKSDSEDFTVKIESGRSEIQRVIREMTSPVEGLAFDEEKLLYKGIAVSPDSLSTSEIMELGIRLKMAENPNLGILFIERGESLGAKRLKEIQEIADNNGFQLIMEQVERGKESLEIEIMAI